MMSGGMVAGDEGTAFRAPTADLARSYREAVRTSLQEQLGDSEQNLIAGREELQRLSRRFVTLERQLVAQARRTDELQELSEAAASAEAELARLLAVPGVQHIEVHGQVLHMDHRLSGSGIKSPACTFPPRDESHTRLGHGTE